MILVDKALLKRAEEKRPLRVGLVGAGFMGRGIARQIISRVPGMAMVAICNRHLESAVKIYTDTGCAEPKVVRNCAALEMCVSTGVPAVCDDPMLICQAGNIDVVVEATGQVEFSAGVALETIRNAKHLVLMNAELDATLGPILKHYADKAGVVYTQSDGDQPGVIMNLYRFVKGVGQRPVLAGNMKGLQDEYRNPETQKAYAAQYHLTPEMATAFADGSKVSLEMAVVANGTGLRVGRRGMYGPRCGKVTDAVELFPKEQLLNGGLIDYILGAEPAPGVFVIGYDEDPEQQHYLHYYKMGPGPFYVFYRPYHLCHLETPSTIARAALFQDAVLAPLEGPVCDVVAQAKRNLKAGEVLDGIGGFMHYGVAENAEVALQQNLLPIGLALNCRLKRDISKDQAITYNDVQLPPGRLCDRLRNEQNKLFNMQFSAAAAL